MRGQVIEHLVTGVTVRARVPATPLSLSGCKKDVDARDKRGHDEWSGNSITPEQALVTRRCREQPSWR
jgi:hypothetical protein